MDAACVAMVIVGENFDSSAIDSSSFSFDAGGRGTQSRCWNHSTPSTPTATETCRVPIASRICWIHAVGDTTTWVAVRDAALSGVGAKAAAVTQATTKRMSRRARITRPMLPART